MNSLDFQRGVIESNIGAGLNCFLHFTNPVRFVCSVVEFNLKNSVPVNPRKLRVETAPEPQHHYLQVVVY